MRLRRLFPLLALFALPVLSFAQEAAEAAPKPEMSAPDSAWMIVATALVLLMTPGLALFYAGMVHRKNVLNTMLMSFVMMGVISILWVLVGFSLAFGTSTNGFIGDFTYFMGQNLAIWDTGYETAPTIPIALFMLFQMKFAIITPALISGAVVERIKFSGYLLFTILWSLIVYAPLACWVWNPGGWLFKMGALDFAGGTVVHLASGVSALALCIALGKRKEAIIAPNNTTMVLLGGGLLWFGWFGFNAGSAVGVSGAAVNAFLTTHLSAAAGMVAWMLAEKMRHGKATAIGAASGLVAGLVGITPAAGFVGVGPAILIGLIAGSLCFFAIQLKHKAGYDDALDVVAVHGVGGTLGAILTGVFADAKVNSLVTKPMGEQIVTQLIGVVATIAFAGILSFVIAKLVDATVGLRVKGEDEAVGLDETTHGESGYGLDLAMAER